MNSPPYEKVTPCLIQGSPTPDVDWPCIPIVAIPDEPDGTVSCATVTVPEGPLDGFSQNTAPSVEVRGVVSVQLSKSRPTALSTL